MKNDISSKRLIEIQMMAGLRKYLPPQGTLLIDTDDTVMDVIQKLGIDKEIVQMAFVDGKFINFTTPLRKARKVLLIPAIGGG
jgi:sulfur carrier protein ThiS